MPPSYPREVRSGIIGLEHRRHIGLQRHGGLHGQTLEYLNRLLGVTKTQLTYPHGIGDPGDLSLLRLITCRACSGRCS